MAPLVSEHLPSWATPGTIFAVVNFDGYVVAVSDGFRRFFGWSPAELMAAPTGSSCIWMTSSPWSSPSIG
jgi:hypothetical protein